MITVDHIGVPARVRLDAASFLTRIFGLDGEIPDDGRFAPVHVSSGFTLDFFDTAQIGPMHIAFVTDGPTFDHILEQLRSEGIAYGSEPHDPANGRVDHPLADRGLYFRTPDGHLFEVMASAASEPAAV
jgi:catechol 2,3-dioxygenase-like lactoylglutathione lyase family enzyme